KVQTNFRPEQLWLKDMDDWNPHDLRRTVRTGLSRLGCPSDIAEAVLGHSKKGIEGTYNLHNYEKECAEWLQKWADY
ncbi:integrase, partial [Acinetobacter nosocomialis]